MATVYSAPLTSCEPFARALMEVHPTDDGTDDDNIFSSVLSQTPKLSNRSSSLINNILKTDELWVIREVPQGKEELYANGKCVYWTRNSIIIKSFNFTEQVIKVFWADFNKKDHVCVALSSGLSIFDRSGQHFQVPIPFAYQEIYPGLNGLIIERSCYQSDDPLPMLFSLTHPTQEATPVLFKSNFPIFNISLSDTNKGGDNPLVKHIAQSMPDYMSIVSCHDKLPICLLYNSQACQHSLWKTSLVTDEELDEYQRMLNDDATLQTTNQQASASCSIRDRELSHLNLGGSLNLSNKQRSSLMMHSNPSSINSPKLETKSRASLGMGSLLQSRLGPCNRLPMGPSEPNTSNLKSFGSTRTLDPINGPNRTRIINYLRDNIEEPVLPELKLEHIWTETSTNSLKASKFFTYLDFVDNEYLVIVTTATNQLKIMKFDSKKLDSSIMSGRPNFIPALDAMPLHKLKMMLIMDHNRNIVLYSGFDRVTQLTIPQSAGTIGPLSSSSPAQTKPQPKMDSTPVQSSSARKRCNSCDRDHSRPDRCMFMQFFQSISPVAHKQDIRKAAGVPIGMNEIKRLEHVVGNDVYILNQANNRGHFTIPSLCQTSTIKRLLDGIRLLTSGDSALYIISNWYQARRASTQPDLMTAKNELRLFKEWLVSSIGILHGNYFEHDQSFDSDFKLPTADKNAPDLSVKFAHQSPTKKSRRYKDPPSNNIIVNNIFNIFYAMHLVFEDLLLMKLNYELCSDLSELLMVLACFLKLDNYQNYYWLKFPSLGEKFGPHKKDLDATNINLIESLVKPVYFSEQPPSVIGFINKMIAKSRETKKSHTLCHYPNLGGVTQKAYIVISLFCEMFNVDRKLAIVNISNHTTTSILNRSLSASKPSRSIEYDRNLVSLMVELDKNRNFLASLPHGLNLYLWDSILNCRDKPPTGWTEACYKLIGRMDLVSLVSGRNNPSILNSLPPTSGQSPNGQEDIEQDDTIKLIFPDDIRVIEANRMLASNTPVEFSPNSRQGATDDEIRQETTRMMYLLNIRTMGMPVGRGAMGLHTYSPVIGESFEVPRLELSGRSLSEERPLDFTHDTTVYPWPFFHNGVAAGLRICASTSNNIIDSTWINYNRPRSNIPHGDMRDRDMTLSNMNNEHAGFLFALGLSGHLEKLSLMALHDYLCQNNDLTKLAILLGMSAAKRGTRDNNIIKVLSIHVDALLPPNSTELDVPPPVHAASIMGVGLLYQGSGDSHISKVLLEEIGRTPGPELNSHIDRESYSLSAGLAFGLVNLCKGGSTTISSSDQLRDYMLGGHRRPFTLAQRERYFKQDCHRGEEEYINTHITAPAGTLGLGLMYHRSGNASVANWMQAPGTQKLLESVRPDHLMLRMIAYGLIMWDEIQPTEHYISGRVPPMIFKHAFQRDKSKSKSDDDSPPDSPIFATRKVVIDYELVSQSYCCIVSGCCMAIALRYAGTANREAYNTIYRHLKFLMKLNTKPLMIEQAGRPCVEACLNVLITALAVVMAGTGDLGVMRACRYLRSRLTQNCIFYGSYMAIHMALGILFLGSCRYSLKTSPESIGALVCALYPVYPSHTSDNRYHLQALRHLYVLAAEPRLLIPRDIETGRPVYVNVVVRLKESSIKELSRLIDQPSNQDEQQSSDDNNQPATDQSKLEVKLKAPCLLPETENIESINVVDERYWNIEISNKRNDLTRCLLHALGQLDVKLKAHSTTNQLVMDIEKFVLKDMPNGVKKSRKTVALQECVKKERVEQFAALNQLVSNFENLIKPSKTPSSSWLVSSSRKDIGSINGHSEQQLNASSPFKSIILEQLMLASKWASEYSGKKVVLDPIRRIIDELDKKLDKTEEGLFLKATKFVQGESDWTSLSPQVAEFIVLNNLERQQGMHSSFLADFCKLLDLI